MPSKSSASSSSKELLAKLNGLLDCAARLSPKEKRRLIDNPKSLVEQIGPARITDKWLFNTIHTLRDRSRVGPAPPSLLQKIAGTTVL